MKAVSQVLLQIDAAFQDEIITDSGLKLFLDSSYRKEHNVASIATVAKLPLKVSAKDKLIIDKLKEGDEVAISYRVVADFEFRGDGEQFMPTTEGNDLVREWRTGSGKWLRVYALPKRKGFTRMWVGILQDKFNNIVTGQQGSESEVNRWLAQFPLGKTDIYSFNNFFEYEKTDYWKCDPSEIFAKRVKGKWEAVGDRVLCRPIDEDVPAELLQNIQHHSSVKFRHQDRATVVSGRSFKEGEVIQFPAHFVEKYDFLGVQYYLINERFVFGKWTNN